MKILSLLSCLMFAVVGNGQLSPIIFDSEFDDNAVFIEELSDGTFFTVWRQTEDEESTFSLLHFDINGVVIEIQELPSIDGFILLSTTSSILHNGVYYIYGNCVNYSGTSYQAFIYRYTENLDFISAHAVGLGGIQEFIRDLIIVDDTNIYIAGLDYAYFGRAFLHKLDMDLNIINSLTIDTAGGFSTAKLWMDYNSSQLLMFMHLRKVYYVDTADLTISTTYFLDDIDGLSVREVLPIPENELYILPVLNPLGDGDAYDDLEIFFKDKDFNTIAYHLFSMENKDVIQSKNTLHYIDPQNIWVSFSTWDGEELPEEEKENQFIGAISFDVEGNILTETYLGGDYSYVAFATQALEDGGTLILTVRYDWQSADEDKAICIFRLDVDGNVVVGVDEIDVQQDILVYPNPASNHLTISSALFSNAVIELFDISGKLVITDFKTTFDHTVQIPEIASGNYLLKLTNNSGEIITRNVVIAK